MTNIYNQTTNYKVSWRLVPRKAPGYDFKDVTEKMVQSGEVSVDQTGWYYLLQQNLDFHFQVRSGDYTAAGMEDLLEENFRLKVAYSGKEDSRDLGGEFSQVVFDGSTGTGNLDIPKAWKYNLDGSLIDYSLEQKLDLPQAEKDILPIPEAMDLEEDEFALTYDNHSTPNHGTDVTTLYTGGTMFLTLQGQVRFQAQKEWLDDGTEEAREKRPSGTFQLWRYRLEKTYASAAPVRKDNGDIIELTLDTTKDSQVIQFTENKDGSGAVLEFPKYDTEGYRYIYAVKEYLEDDPEKENYEKLFEDNLPSGPLPDGDTERIAQQIRKERSQPGNIFIYNWGLLQNRISDTVTARVTKTWDAAAFQAGFQDVRVELQLESRLKGSELEEDWKPVEGKKLVLEGFEPEILTKSAMLRVPLYNSRGETLEYRWVESGVYQGKTSTENLLEDGKYFTLSQEGRPVRFESLAEKTDSESTLITNTFALHTQYHLQKIWLDGEGNPREPDPDADVKFEIYRTVADAPIGDTPVAAFRLNGQVDEEPLLVNEELQIYAQETSPWHCTVWDLEEYTPEGAEYEYFALEVQNEFGSYLRSETEKKADGYHTKIFNGPGDGYLIRVKKNWVDDSDILHRHPVTIGVYRKSDNELIGSTVLGGKKTGTEDSKNPWYDEIGIGSLKPEEVYILETKIGDTEVTLNNDPEHSDEPRDPLGPGAQMPIFVTTPEHHYAVTYGHESAGEADFFTVTNRRLGKMSLQVRKNWVDGDKKQRELIRQELETLNFKPVIQLEFEGAVPDYYKISRSTAGEPDTVDVGYGPIPIQNELGEPASSDQILDMRQDPKELYTFANLPKYDKNGAVVHYTASEIWLDDKGQRLTVEQVRQDYPDLDQMSREYHLTYTQDSYTVGSNHSDDLQKMTITNQLKAEKDVLWHKQWKDMQNFISGKRPDIYLDIYQQKHVQKGDSVELVTEDFLKDYKWVFEDTGATDKRTHWHADLRGLPKYDDLGYEIIYYAQERTHVRYEDFDYLTTQYAWEEDATGLFGTAVDIAEEYRDDYGSFAIAVGRESVPTYALKEGGTFVNQIRNDISVMGQKLWKALPLGYTAENLPDIRIDVMRKSTREFPDGTAAPLMQKAASLVIDDWAGIYHKGQYNFKIEFEGENHNHLDSATKTVVCTGAPGAKHLSKYDPDGWLYEYEIKETILWPTGSEGRKHQDVFMDPVVNTFQIANTYDSIEGAVGIRKILELPLDQNGNIIYPAVKFKLSRSFLNDGGALQEDPQFVKYQVWSAAKVKQAAGAGTSAETTLLFENLPIYAPNGNPYVYRVEEIKNGFLNDFDTWAGPGDLTKDGVKQAGFAKKEQVDALVLTQNQEDGRGETAQDVAVAATFYNEIQKDNRQRVILEGRKDWADFQNAFGLRPDALQVKVSRTAAAQDSQGNAMSEVMDPSQYKILWKGPEDPHSTVWTYEVVSADSTPGEKLGLDRYAPNGMLWKYTVEEILADDSPYQAVSPKAWESGSSGKLSALQNSLITEQPFAKKWVDSSGAVLKTDYYDGAVLNVTFRLQVNPGDGWVYADEYFKANLNPAVLDQVFGDNAHTGLSLQKTLTGSLESPVWGQTQRFTKLPAVIKDSGGELRTLRYRAVETSAGFQGGQKYTYLAGAEEEYRYDVTGTGGLIKPYYPGGNPYASTDTVMYNQLSTLDLTVRKTFTGDSGNAYHTRPDSRKPGSSWEISLVVERRGSAGWKLLTQNDQPLILHIYGTNADPSGTVTLKGLPAADIHGNAYEYRAVELEPHYVVNGSGKTVADPDFWYLPQDLDTVKKAMVPTGSIFAKSYESSWDGASGTLTNELKTTAFEAKKTWHGPAVGPVTLNLQYEDREDHWVTLASVTLDGTKDLTPGVPYYEKDAWVAVFENVPTVIPGTLFGKRTVTAYRIQEVIPPNAAYQSAEGTETICAVTTKEGKTDSTAEFINVEKTSFLVEKKWGTRGAKPEITLKLYRTTDPGEVGKAMDGNRYLYAGHETETLSVTGMSGTKRFDNLPKYDENGKLYHYYALETKIGADSVEDTAYDVQYTHDAKTTDGIPKTVIVNIGSKAIQVEKHWLDDGNINRPQTLTVQLQRQSLTDLSQWDVLQTVSMSPKSPSDKTWTVRFEDLPEADPKGTLYTYRIKELDPGKIGEDAYTPVGDCKAVYNPAKDQYEISITNTLHGEVSIPVIKKWYDGSDVLGLRPDDLQLEVYNGTTKVTGYTIDKVRDGNEWTYTIENLPKYDASGKLISYTVQEIVPDGYAHQLIKQTQPKIHSDGRVDDEQTAAVLRNTLITSHQVRKNWEDTKTSHPEVTVRLMVADRENAEGTAYLKNGKPYELVLSDTAGWTGKFLDLPQFTDDGRRLYYHAVEVTIGNEAVEDQSTYQVTENTAGNLTTITNTQMVRHQAVKLWKDNSDSYHTRPEKPEDLKLILERTTGSGTWETVARSYDRAEVSGDTWTYVYENLPLTDSSRKVYHYRVREEVPKIQDSNDTYEKKEQHAADPNAETMSTITNTLTGKVSFQLTKTWVDGNDQDGKRPDVIRLNLLQNGVKLREIEVRKPSSPKNTNQWIYESGDLPKYDSEGRLYEYTLEELDVAGYEKELIANTGKQDPDRLGRYPDRQKDAELKNTLLTDHKVEKKWHVLPEDTLPDKVTVQLMRTVGSSQTAETVKRGGKDYTLDLTAADGWKGTFRDLPKYSEAGEPYHYFAKEILIGTEKADQQTVYEIQSQTREDLTTIVNIRRIQKQAIKLWKDHSDAYGTRPDSLTVHLERSLDGKTWETVPDGTYTAQCDKVKDTWTYTFTGLPITDLTGKPYAYRMIETVPAIEGKTGNTYEKTEVHTPEEAVISTITNTLTGKVSLPVRKVWVDNGDKLGKRPDEIQVELYADDVRTGKTLTLKPGTISGLWDADWQGSFKDLPKYDDGGRQIVYTVREVLPNHYRVTYDPSDKATEEGVTLTNTGEGMLVVTKEIVGKNKNPRFDFKITLTPVEDGDADREYPYEILDSKGKVRTSGTLKTGDRISLGHKEKLQVYEILHDTAYRVEELDPGQYLVKRNRPAGVVKAGEISTAEFINREKTALIQTGQDWLLPGALGASGVLLVLSGALLLVLKKKKQK